MGAVRMTEDRIQLIARALADPRRLDLLRRIGRSSDTARCSDLLCSAGVTAATLSHHMKELEIAGLVEAEREGRTVTYRLRRNVLEQYLANLAKI